MSWAWSSKAWAWGRSWAALPFESLSFKLELISSGATKIELSAQSAAQLAASLCSSLFTSDDYDQLLKMNNSIFFAGDFFARLFILRYYVGRDFWKAKFCRRYYVVEPFEYILKERKNFHFIWIMSIRKWI